MNLGDCFFTPETSGVVRHLWSIVSDPTKHSAVVIVNFSTKPSPATAASGQAANVMAGEHPSIARASYVRCEEARLVQTTDLQRLIDSGKLTPTQAASPALVAKVQAALGASRETKLEIQAVLRTQGFT